MTDDETTDRQTPDEEPDTFPREYVEELRAEAAEHRTKAKEATETVGTFKEALREAMLRRGSDGILVKPVPWDDSYDGEDGLPDLSKIAAAAEALAIEKPWLSRPRGDAGQGFRGEDSDTVNLANLLRSGA